MPTDPRVHVRITASLGRGFGAAYKRARRLVARLRREVLTPEQVETINQVRAHRRRTRAYRRRSSLPGPSSRSARWRAGTRRTKHHARGQR